MLNETRPHLLVEWNEDSTRSRRRESGLASAVLHLAIVILVVLSPKILPERTFADEPRQVTLLYLPSDALKTPEPEPQPGLTPEERQRPIARGPLTLDRRQLELVLPPLPPSPPADTVPPGGDAGGAPGRGNEPSPPGGGAPGEGRQIARLENLPRPERSPRPGLELPMTTPGRAIDETLRQGPGSPGGSGGTPGQPGEPITPDLNTPFPTILSDTRGVDFGPYLIRLLREVRRNWYAVIPESVRWGEQGRVVIVFSIQKDGVVPLGQPTIVRSSGRSHLDRPALGAIRASQPFPPLPSEFSGDNIVLQFTFLYNLPVNYDGP